MKKIIASIMAFLLLCSSIAFADFEEEDSGKLKPGDEYKDGILTEDDFKEVGYADASGSIFYSDMEDYSIVGILGALDIMGAAEGTLFKPNSYISRGEFAESLLKLLKINYSDPKNINTGEFYDVDKDSPWYNVVYHALASDLISGYSDNSFRPDDVMTYSEAKSCIVRALGYNESFGTYDKLASDLGVTKRIHVKNAKAITRLEMATLLYNALEIPTSELKINTGNTVYTATGKTILYNIWNMYRSEGQVTTSFVETIGTMPAEKNTVVINDSVRYKTPYTSDQHFMGYKVNYYYDEDENLVYMYKDKKVEEIIIDSDDLVSFNNGAIRYMDNGKAKIANLEFGYTKIYNGMRPDSTIFTDDNLFKIGNGSIRLISNDGGSTYNIVMIEEYRDYLVKSASSTDTHIEILLDGGKIKLNISQTHLALFDENEAEQEVYRVTDSGEETIDLSVMKENSVISVFTEFGKLTSDGFPTEDTRYMKIISSDKTISGKLESIDTAENELIIDSEIYSAAVYWNEGDPTVLPYLNMSVQSLGSDVNYFVDYKNRILTTNDEKEIEGWQYVYLMKVYKNYDNPGAINEIMVFDIDAEAKRYKLSDTLRINGYKVKPETVDARLQASAAYIAAGRSALSTDANGASIGLNKTYGQLLKIMVNEDTVEAMEIITNETDNGRSTNVPETQLYRHSEYTKNLSSRFVVYMDSDNVFCKMGSSEGLFRKPDLVFHVPYTDSDDPSQYQIHSINKASELVMDFYDVDNMRAKVAVRYQDVANALPLTVGDGSSVGWWVMFDSKEYALNEDEEPVMKFKVLQYNGINEYYTKDQTVINKLNTLEKGCLIRLSGIKKEVTSIDVATYNGQPIGPNNLPVEYVSTGEAIPANVSNIGRGFVEGDGNSSYVRLFDVYDTFSSSYFCIQTGPLQDGRARSKQILGLIRLTAWQKAGVLLYQGDGTMSNGIIKNGTVQDLRSVKQYGTQDASLVFALPHEGGSRLYIVYNIDR